MGATFRRGAAGLALVVAGWLAAQPLGAAVTISASPHLDQQRQPDGGVLLRLAASADPTVTAWPLVVDHDRPLLRADLPGGGRSGLSFLELEAAGTRHRSGALAPATLLATGLLLRDEGEREARRPLRALAPVDPWAPHHFARLEVQERGVVQVTAEWLAARVPGPWPDPRTWSLIHNGRVEPLLAEGCEDGSFDAGDRLVFWAEPTLPAVPELGPDTRRDPWNAREVYFLASDGSPGVRLVQETGEIVETDPDVYHTPLSFPASVLMEEDNHFSRLTYVLDEAHPDHQFWTTGIYGGVLRSVSFLAPGLDRFNLRPARMKVCLRGLTAPTEENDPDVFQRMRLFVNNQGGAALEVGAAGDWRNQDLRIVEFGTEAFPDHSAFLPGLNTLFLAGVDEPPAGAYSAAMLNWVELSYQRLFRAEEDWLEFTADPALDGRIVNFEITGFDDPDILVIKPGQSHLRSVIVRPQSGGWRLRFQDEFRAGTRYVAVGRPALREPLAAEPVTWHNLGGHGAGAGILVVVADSLMRAGAAATLAPVLERARDLGGEALVVSDRWVYDEFSHGRTLPHGIRDLVLRAWAAWDTPPRWLLLVGDGILTPRSVVPGREPVLPLMYEQVYKWGAASSDDWYVRDNQGTTLPVLVSRWPVATAAELHNLAEKELAYRGSAPGPWRNSLLFTSGARAQDDGVFMAQSEQLIRFRIPSHFFVRRINAGEQGGAYIGSRPELLRLINQGQLLVNYSGHGGGAVWEDNGLFRSEDVPLLDNAARLPFVTNATCFIASLDYQGAMGRALLNSGPMGAIGVLGSTGLGFRDTGMELVTEFISLQCANPDLTVAAVLREAKQRLWLRHVLGREGSVEARQARAVIVMNTILGLPWQQLHTPGGTSLGLENPLAVAGDTLRLHGQAELPGAQGRIEVYSATVRPAQVGPDFVDGVVRQDFTADATGRWEARVPVPASLPGGGAVASLRAWLAGATTGGQAGVTWFYRADSLEQTLIWRAGLVPDPPRPGQLLGVEVHVAGPDPPDSVAALLRAWPPGQDSLDLRLPLTPRPGDPQRLVSAASAGPWPDSTLVRLQFALYHGAERDSTTWSWYLLTSPRPRLEWQTTEGTDERGRRLLALANAGDADSDTLLVRLRRRDGTLSGWSLLPPVPAHGTGRAALELPPVSLGDTLIVEAAWDPHVGGIHPTPLTLVADPLPLAGRDWRRVAPGLDLRLPAEAGNRVLLITALDLPDAQARQEALRPSGPGWRLQWLDGLAPAPVEGRLALAAPDSLMRERSGLLVYHEGSRLVLSGPVGQVEMGRADSLLALFRLDEGDGLLMGWLDDQTPPTVRMEVEGQVFASGGYLPPGGVISWMLEDPAGVDPRPGRLALQVGNQPVAPADLALQADHATGRLAVQLQLDPGLPREEVIPLRLSCTDAAGNTTQWVGECRIGERLALRYAGTYPNPFQRETRFVFSLTGVAEGATIDIFTVAGRRIRRLEIPGPLINYVEVLWDGRDRVGDVVANGVYYYRLQARGAEGAIDHSGKVARLK
jgi:hypothetical protein